MHVLKANNSWEAGSKKTEITFVGNSQNIVHTMFLPNICQADRTSKVCLTNATTKKLQENKLKLY